MRNMINKALRRIYTNLNGMVQKNIYGYGSDKNFYMAIETLIHKRLLYIKNQEDYRESLELIIIFLVNTPFQKVCFRQSVVYPLA